VFADHNTLISYEPTENTSISPLDPAAAVYDFKADDALNFGGMGP
jgi:hypothetical protein